MENLLGTEVKDMVTGFKGIAVAKCMYMNGCVQYSVQSPIDEKGEIPKEVWIDAQQLEVISDDLPFAMGDEYMEKSGGGFRSHP